MTPKLSVDQRAKLGQMAHVSDTQLYAQWTQLLDWLEEEARTRQLQWEKVADFPDYIYRMERPYELDTTVMSVSLNTQTGQPLMVAAVSPRHVDLKHVSLRLMGGSKHWHLHAGPEGLLEGKRLFTQERLKVLLDGAQQGIQKSVTDE